MIYHVFNYKYKTANLKDCYAILCTPLYFFAVGSTIVAVSYAVGADDEERLQLRKIPSEIMIHWNKGEAAFPVEKGKEIPPIPH